MYAHIDGVVAEKGAGMLVIDCHGVGYLMSVSGSTLSQAPAVGERMKCYTHLSVRRMRWSCSALPPKRKSRCS